MLGKNLSYHTVSVQPTAMGYLVERRLEKVSTALAVENGLNSPQRSSDCIRESYNTRGVNCKVCWTHAWGFQTINLYIHIYIYPTFCSFPNPSICAHTFRSYFTLYPLGDKVSMLTHIYPHKARRKIEVIICKVTRLTTHFMCGLMSDLLICTCL